MAGSGRPGASPKTSGPPVAVATTPPITSFTPVAMPVASLSFPSPYSCSPATVAPVATVSVGLRGELLVDEI